MKRDADTKKHPKKNKKSHLHLQRAFLIYLLVECLCKLHNCFKIFNIYHFIHNVALCPLIITTHPPFPSSWQQLDNLLSTSIHLVHGSMVSWLIIDIFTFWQHLKSYQFGYQLVTVSAQGDFIVLPCWENGPHLKADISALNYATNVACY